MDNDYKATKILKLGEDEDYYDATECLVIGDIVPCWDADYEKMILCEIIDIRHNVNTVCDEHPHPALFDIRYCGEDKISYGHEPCDFFEEC